MSDDKLESAWAWVAQNQTGFNPADLSVIPELESGRTRVRIDNPNGLFAKTFKRWQELCRELGIA